MYYNAEHYPDPTAGAAFRKIHRRENSMNTGKRFELDFKSSVPGSCWYYRFRDNPATYYGGSQDGLRFASDNICDCQIYKAPYLHLIELKSVGTPSASLTAMFGKFDPERNRYKKQKHLEDMAAAACHEGITASVLINFRISDRTWAVPVREVLPALCAAAAGGRKSLTEAFCAERGFLVPQRKLRVNWRYDVDTLVAVLADGKEESYDQPAL